MNEHLDLERTVAENIASEGIAPPSDAFYDELFSRAERSRQWPRWLATIKEPPMRLSSALAVGSPTARFMAPIVAALLLLVVAAGGIAGGRLLAAEGPIIVDATGNGTVETIKEAVAQAEDGDLILVRPGTYDEQVIITKDIAIRGDDDYEREEIVVEVTAAFPPGASASSAGLPAAFTFEDSDASLEHMTLRGDGSRIVILGGAPVLQDLFLDGIGMVIGVDPGQSLPDGLWIKDGSTATVQDNQMDFVDVVIEQSAAPLIVRNVLDGGSIWMQGTGVDPVIRENTIEGSAVWGIAVWGGASATLESNHIDGATTGIDIQDRGHGTPDRGTSATLVDNTVTNSRASAVIVGRDTTAHIEGSTLIDNPTGISLQATSASVEKNSISGGITGIVVSAVGGDGSPTLTGNTVRDATNMGIFVSNGSSPMLTGNSVCGSPANLVIGETAEPILEGNDICENAAVDASG